MLLAAGPGIITPLLLSGWSLNLLSPLSALFQIAQSVADSGAAGGDADTIPDPDGPPPTYLGYEPRGDRRANERSVKKILGNIKKSGFLDDRGRRFCTHNALNVDEANGAQENQYIKE